MSQSFIAGQAFWGRICFPDGGIPAYDRPYLIIGVFPKRTFVKLDSLQRVHISNLSNISMARNGKTLDAAELSEIISAVIRA